MSALTLSGPRDAKGWLVTPALGFIVALFIYPFAYGLMLSFEPMNGGGVLANYRAFFTDSSMWSTIWSSPRPQSGVTARTRKTVRPPPAPNG